MSLKRGSGHTGGIRSVLTALPRTVVSLLIVNSDDFAPSEFDTVFKAAGLDTLAYAPESASLSASGWPTLGTLIDSGKRLVTFMDAEADFTSVPYIIDGAMFPQLVVQDCLADR